LFICPIGDCGSEVHGQIRIATWTVTLSAENKALTLVCSLENGLFMGQKTLEDLLQQLWPLREALAFDPDESTKEAIGDWHTGSLRGGVL
jgi:hypothetical protein